MNDIWLNTKTGDKVKNSKGVEFTKTTYGWNHSDGINYSPDGERLFILPHTEDDDAETLKVKELGKEFYLALTIGIAIILIILCW